MENNLKASVSSAPAFTIKSVLSQSWSHVKGAKWPIWAVVIVAAAIVMLVNALLDRAFGVDIEHPSFWINFVVIPIVSNAIAAPFYAGALMVAVKRARDERVTGATGYQFFHRYIPVAITLIIIGILSGLLVGIVNTTGISQSAGQWKGLIDLAAGVVSMLVYLFLMLSIPLVIDKNYSPWQAMSTSCKLVSHHWFKIFVIVVIGYLAFIVFLIPLFIGLTVKYPVVILLGLAILIVGAIWIVPFLLMINGVVYRLLVDKQA